MGKHSKGGEEGVELIKGSQVKDRDPITQKTTTALYFHFLPAQNNMEEFTDKYGKCWSEKPPKDTYNVFGEEIKMGAEDYLLAIEKQKKKQGDVAYNEQLRTYPRTVDHMMRDEATECVFNMTKLIEQIDYNDSLPEESRYMVGNFEWKDGVKDSDVEFYPNPKGRFKVSWFPSVVDNTEGLANRVGNLRGQFFPMNKDLARFGCDPFSINGSEDGSKGGLHGLTLKLPEGGAPSNQFVVEYIARPTDSVVFFEDVIKCIRYYGSPILIESNRGDILRHFYLRGYRRFVMNRLDKPTNKLTEGELKYGGQTMSGSDILDSHMNAIGSWIERYVGESTNEEFRPLKQLGEMPFNETLRDWLKFDPKQRTKHDATISSGLAIMACQKDKYKKKSIKRDNGGILKGLLKKYDNSGNMGSLIR